LKRVVLDTNVTISALFWKGYPRTVYDLISKKRLIMLLSSEMEREFIRVLGYPKFGLLARQISPFIKNLRSYAEFVEIYSNISEISADPTDNIFLECAVDGKADYIISGDKHLLELSSYAGVPIVKSKDFLLREKLIKVD
jgi:uncharacterized protein